MIIAKTREEHLRVLNKAIETINALMPNMPNEISAELSYSVGFLLGQNEMLKQLKGLNDDPLEA